MIGERKEKLDKRKGAAGRGGTRSGYGGGKKEDSGNGGERRQNLKTYSLIARLA